MRREGPWRLGAGDVYGAYQSKEVEMQRAALLVRQEKLKDQLLRMQQHQIVDARRRRREELRAQIQRLEYQVYQYELKTSSPSRSHPSMGTNLTAKTPLAPLNKCLSVSNESLLERLVQQNEQLMALLLPRKNSGNPAEVLAKGVGTETSSNEAPPLAAGSACPTSRSASPNAEKEKSFKSVQPALNKQEPFKQAKPKFLTPPAVSWLPDVTWTDEDEMTLMKLESGEDVVDPVIPASESNSTIMSNSQSSSSSHVLNELKSRDRLESRKKLEALLSTSMQNGNGGALRKPRWRLEDEAASDEVAAFALEDADVMKPLQVFRSTVITVMYALHLNKLLLAKKMAEKESRMRDFEAMLRVYFDATRMWLGKVVRPSLLSLLDDSGLDVDISLNDRIAVSSLRGFANKFGSILARRPRLPPGRTVDPTKLLKLKVRLKGILQALSTAINKKEVPSGILDFWKRISTDGVYFPPSYHIFPEERQCFEFDDLGATRRMDFETNVSIDQDQSGQNSVSTSGENCQVTRFNVVLINFLFVRILIPHIILQPWNVAIGSKRIGKHASANLASLATLLYFVCRQLSPLPPPTDFGRRHSQPVNDADRESQDQSLAASSAVDAPSKPEDEELSADTAFLSIDEIGKQLILDKNFPCNDTDFILVVKEHQSMLRETLQTLRSQLSSPREKISSTVGRVD